MKTVECLVPNVWTSKGKLSKGEKANLDLKEADFLAKRKQVKIVKGKSDA